MRNDIQTKAAEIVNKAEQAKDLKVLSQMELLGFLSSAIKGANEEDEILAEANKQLLDRLKKSPENDPMSLSALVRIIEMKEKNSIERKTPILKILEAAIKPNPAEKQKESENIPSNVSKENDFSQDDYSKAKKALDEFSKLGVLLEKIKKAEGVKE